MRFERAKLRAALLAAALLCPLAAAAEKKPPAKPINLNAATLEELKQLPGVGEVIAQRILRHREKHGRFRRVEELLVIRGISQKKFDALRLYVTLEEAKEAKEAEEAEEAEEAKDKKGASPRF